MYNADRSLFSARLSLAGLTARRSPGVFCCRSEGKATKGPFGLDMPTGNNISFQPEFAYSMAGMKDNDGKLIRLNYINVPLLAKYVVSNTGLNLFVGPQIGILFRAQAYQYGNWTDIKAGSQDFDLAAVFGAGFQPPKSRFVISARYQLSFTNVFDGLPGDATVKNRIVTFLVGYRLK